MTIIANSVADGNGASTNYTLVDHTEWNILLARYVIKDADGVNKFIYQSFAPQDHNRLNAYIAMLEKTIVSDLAADAQLAYWINLYNAITVRVILNHYPLDSIRDNRTHYALNCASIGCPNLQTRAYTHDNLEQLLDAAARE